MEGLAGTVWWAGVMLWGSDNLTMTDPSTDIEEKGYQNFAQVLSAHQTDLLSRSHVSVSYGASHLSRCKKRLKIVPDQIV